MSNLLNIGLGLQGSLGEQQSWQNGSGGGYGYGRQQGTSLSDAYGESWNNAVQNAYNRVYGSEATQADISNAREANEENRAFWAMQADYNAREAQINRDYQTAMSNTAYQRAVKDLEKAGLNPILAVGGGMQASSPMGATAVSGLSSAAKANSFADSIGYSSGSSSGGSYNRQHGESQNSAFNENSSWWNTSGGSYGWTGNNVASAAKTLGEMVQGAFDAFENYAMDPKNNTNNDEHFNDNFGMTPHSTAEGWTGYTTGGRGRQTYVAQNVVKQTVNTAGTLAKAISKSVKSQSGAKKK